MATTPRILSEQIQRIYTRPLHQDDLKPTLDRREVKRLMFQAINEILKIQSYEGMTVGRIDIPKCSIATYPPVSVSSSNSISTITLPAIPIHLPMDMGVWEIVKTTDPWNPYIPIVGQDASVMQGTPAAFLEDQVGYYVDGQTIRFTKDILNAPYSISNVDVKLLVQETSQIADDDVLPITADQEIQVIQSTLKLLAMGKVALQELNKQEEIQKQLKHENE